MRVGAEAGREQLQPEELAGHLKQVAAESRTGTHSTGKCVPAAADVDGLTMADCDCGRALERSIRMDSQIIKQLGERVREMR